MKEARIKKDISQRELARRTGIDKTEISRIESGKRASTNFFSLKSLANELGLDIKEVMKLSNYTKIEMDFYIKYEEAIGLIHDIELEKFIKEEDKSIDLLKTIREYKKGTIDEEEFIYFVSKRLGINLKKYL